MQEFPPSQWNIGFSLRQDETLMDKQSMRLKGYIKLELVLDDCAHCMQ